MAKQPKTLILCFDGTSNSFTDENTNVVRLFSALEKNEMDSQRCYYQPGIGTYIAPNSAWSPTLQGLAKVLDAGLAWYLDAHIIGGYRFLMENFEAGDKICLFGFSRGAYTARCLAGMLHKVGLLPKSNEEQISFAYKKYKDTTPNGKLAARCFKAAFSRDVCIEFMGVWDTVSSVGVLSRHLPFTASNTTVKTFRHALALDEHRAKFKPNPWHRSAPTAAAAKNDPDKGTPVVPKPTRPGSLLERISDGVKHVGDGVRQEVAKFGEVFENVVGDVVEGKIRHRRTVLRKRTVFSVDSDAIDDGHDDDECEGHFATDVKEVWFAGCHADVGGGSASNNQTNTLANPSLMWMVNEIFASQAPILFKSNAFADIPALETVIITLSDRTPYHRPQLPAFSLLTTLVTTKKGAEWRDTCRSPAVEEYTRGSNSGQSKWDLIRTLSASGLTAATTIGKDGRISIQRPSAPILIEESPNGKGDLDSSNDGITVVQVFEDDPIKDANAEMFDQLEKRWAWWILEFVPLWQYHQDNEGHWHKGFYCNRGRPREIQDPNPLFHSSVKLRADYTPRAKLPKGSTITYVD
ncbi:hypothetical protein FRC04_002083 [Tulasnella sp. 424]|nr:hypothetical protein FRC04_002083 [Tulasnella sp. 424]KAG8968001.1 hypothetical protein FRC05_001711 [Tulasnella sp. 425]